MTNFTIRRAVPDDRQAFCEICLKTADAGEDGTALYSDPDYPALIWALPYLEFDPDFAFVLDDGGTAVGYVIGAHDTARFETRLAAEWWPVLQAKYGDRIAKTARDKAILSLIATPPSAPADRVSVYPAHLHIDLLPVAQGAGWGRLMMETLLASLREAGVPGVHLGVGEANEKALGFYQRLGFVEIGRNGAIWMGQSL